MAAWSGLVRSAGQILLRNKSLSPIQPLKNGTINRLMSGDRKFQIVPSRWQWDKTKDLFHLYVCVAGIPLAIVITYINVFIGPATLAPIPEGYVPKDWEYHRHPISRWMLRYVFNKEQQEYEKYCHFLWAEQEVAKCRALESKVKALMADRVDYQAYYYQPYTNAKYVRKAAQLEKESAELYAQN